MFRNLTGIPLNRVKRRSKSLIGAFWFSSRREKALNVSLSLRITKTGT
jgi:hypothetical protein